MSGNQERLKLTAKRGKNPNESQQTYKARENEQKNKVKGLKRRLSSETVISNKQMRQKTNLDAPANKKIKSVQPSTSRDLEPVKNKPVESTRNIATSRLTLLREKFKKDIQTTSKPVDKNPVKKFSTISSKNVSQPIKKELKNVSARFKNESKTSSYRIPKKTINERLKIAKEVDSLNEKTDARSEKCVSPVKKSNSIQGGDTQKAHISPLKKSRNVPYNIKDEQVNPNGKSNTALRLSNDYIIISDTSDSESSSKTLTPINQRLNRINKEHISIYDKTLMPGSDRTSDEEGCFKTPSKPQALRVPLNRSIFRNRLETVKTEKNIFESSKGESTEVETKHSPEHRTSIFGATVSSSTFQNASNKTENNIFANNLKYNNNDISPTNLNNNATTGSIFDRPTYQTPAQSPTNIFNVQNRSSGVTKTQNGENNEDKSPTVPIVRHDRNIFANSTPQSTFKTSTNIFDLPGHTADSPEIERREDVPDKSRDIFSTKQISRGSVSNRLARIKSGEVSSYGRKQENAEKIENLDSNEAMEQTRMEPSAMQIGFQEQSRLQTVPSFSKELLTEQWLKSEQCISTTTDYESMSDSMNVNVNDSILNKTELVDPVEDVSMDWDSVPEEADVPPPAEPPKPPERKKENAICVVTDTNVFMHSLHKIKDILNIKLSGTQKISVFIPWMVMVELDHLKDHSPHPTKSIALEAQRYINKTLEEAESRLIGQSIDDLAHQKDIGKDPDDKILSAGLQAVERFKTVIFLTADINLRNKAMINKIETCPPKDIMGRLNVALSKNVKYCEIRRKLGTLCSMIICDCCSAAYGDVWKKMDMLQNPPWSLVECTKRLIKYWSSVFRGDLLKHSQKYIRDLHDFLLKHKDDVVDDSDRFTEFVKLAVHLMFYLRDLPNHKNATQKTMEEIVQIADGR